MDAFTLLHVAGSATPTRGIDLVAAVLALAVFAAVAAAVWIPACAPQALLRRRGRRRLLSLVTGAVVFAAVLPIVLPWDHLFLADHHESTGEAAVHASHCHETPGTCTDAPVTSGPGQLMLTNPLLPSPALLGVLLLLIAPALAGITLRPETRPPLGTITA